MDGALFRFAMISDTHILEPDSAQILVRGLERIQQNQGGLPSFVILGGDMTETGREAEYRTLLEALSRLRIPYHPVVGNHDIGNSRSRRGFTRFFGSPNRSFNFNGARCIILDTNNADPDPEKWHGRVERPAMKWLKAELDRVYRETPILLFTHHGLVGEREDLECDVENAEQVLALLTEHNLLAGFAAHAHRLRLRCAGKASFFVCPALSTRKGNKGGEPPGLLIVDVFHNEAIGSVTIISEDPNPHPPNS